MRILKASIYSVVLITIIFTVSSYAADVKVGVFNFDQIMTDSKLGKAAKTKLEAKHKKLTAVLEKKKAQLEKMDEKLEKDAQVMEKNAYNQKRLEIQKLAIDFKAAERKSTDEIRNLRQELVAEINKKVIGIVIKIGKNENYTMILEKNVAGAAYFDQKIDLTNRVLKALNAM